MSAFILKETANTEERGHYTGSSIAHVIFVHVQTSI